MTRNLISSMAMSKGGVPLRNTGGCVIERQVSGSVLFLQKCQLLLFIRDLLLGRERVDMVIITASWLSDHLPFPQFTFRDAP
jgi:hypothetical protein